MTLLNPMLDRRALLGIGLAVLAPHEQAASQPAQVGGGGGGDDAARAVKLVMAATGQVGVTTSYDPAYKKIPYPGGDVPRDRGVCTDVIVRAYRDAFGVDLQSLVHADMRDNFQRYPSRWGLTKPDPNIDHRRVLNLRVYLTRKGGELPMPPDGRGWQPGDIVSQVLVPPGSAQSGLPHIGIISDVMSADQARRLVLHNIGSGTRAEDILETYQITGRYRWLPSV